MPAASTPLPVAINTMPEFVDRELEDNYLKQE
jgi:hypothetical protein